MECKIEYCIYNQNFKCILDKVTTDRRGNCESCIIVTFDRESVEAEKKRQRQAIERQQETPDQK